MGCRLKDTSGKCYPLLLCGPQGHSQVNTLGAKCLHPLRWPVTFALWMSSDLFLALRGIPVSVNPDIGREAVTLLALVGDLSLSTLNSAGETYVLRRSLGANSLLSCILVKYLQLQTFP